MRRARVPLPPPAARLPAPPDPAPPDPAPLDPALLDPAPLDSAPLGSTPLDLAPRAAHPGPFPAARAVRFPVRSAALLAVFAAACGGLPAREIPPSTNPYDQLPAGSETDFLNARAEFLGGSVWRAREGFEALLERHPRCVVFGVWWQESAARLDDLEAMRAQSEARARSAPSAASCVLAARAHTDPAAAEAWLAWAETLDPECPWVPLGRAHLAAQVENWEAARAALASAIALDPGQLFARRMQAALLARDGSRDVARAELAGWLDRAEPDPRVPPALVAGAQLDLALIDLAAGELGDAEDALDAIDPAWIEPWRLHTARAALLHAGGEHERALAEARAARASAPEEVLPVVQEAFLLEDHLGDPAGAALAWARARELAGEREDLAAALEIVRARVRIERLERAAGERAARASPTP